MSSFHLSSAIGLAQSLEGASSYTSDQLEKLANSLLRLNEKEFDQALAAMQKHQFDFKRVSERGSGLVHYLCHAGVSVDPALLKSFTWIIPKVVAAGSEVGVANKRGYYPVHMASILARGEPLKAVLDAGADIEATCRRGRTPLFYATAASVPELLKRGANVGHVDHKGGGAAWAVAEHASRETVQRLLKAGASADPQLQGEAEVHPAMAEWLRTMHHDQQLRQAAAPSPAPRRARM